MTPPGPESVLYTCVHVRPSDDTSIRNDTAALDRISSPVVCP
jgi:hypothetical protein